MKKNKNGEGTIYKIKSGVYYLQYTDNGKRRKKSLKTTKKESAEKTARELLKEIDRVVDIADVVRTSAMDKGITDKETIGELNKIVDRTSRKNVSIKDVWEKYKAHTGHSSSEATLKECKRYWSRFIRWVSYKLGKNINMHEITIDDAQKFAQYLQKDKGMGSSTYNKYIRFCRLCFKILAYDAGITVNPFEYIATRHGPKGGKRELTVSELKAISEVIDKGIEKKAYSREIKTLFQVGIFTGLRLKDACLLKWGQVNLDRKVISLPPAKLQRGGQEKWIHVPIIPSLHLELMIAADKEELSEYVLPSLAASYHVHRSTPQKLCTKIFQAAGIVTSIKPNNNEKARAITIVGFHSLRHTFVSECAKAGVPLAVVQSVVGHGSPAMTRHYTHIDIDSARKGIEQIDTVKPVIEDKQEKIKALVESLTSNNLEKVKAQILELL